MNIRLAVEMSVIKQEVIKWKICWGWSTLERKVKYLNPEWNHEFFYYLQPIVSTY